MNNEWKLKKFHVELREYGEYAGKYMADVQFKNGERAEFTFALNGKQTQAFLDLIADRVVTISEEMSEKLAESLGVDRTKPEDDIETLFAHIKNKT